jgi:hypothetical protein
LAEQVKRVGGEGCVQAHQLPVGIRAMLAYYGRLNFSSQSCRVAIARDSQRVQSDDDPPAGSWRLAYEFTRRARYDEAFRVWVRDR